jgi:putative oxygen-independent coproporphyrinogen III oxidase
MPSMASEPNVSSLAARDAKDPRSAGVYVHFPWCLAKCPYCDFVSWVEPGADHRAYTDAVLRELEGRAALFEGRQIASIFFGGGTPSLWEAAELERVLQAVRRLATPPPYGEIEVTVECNPTSLDEDKARALVDVGVNRLSIGVQSLSDERLRFLGRLHDVGGAMAAIAGALRAKAPRVSADLIFGVAGQTVAEARSEALALADLGLTHVSCYQLTIEAGTRFGELARRGRLPLADDGAVAEAFVAIEAALTGRGLAHYEVSNYAAAGQEARHNVGYWHGDEYLGLGCGAFGFARIELPGESAHGVRWRNATRPEAYVRGAIESPTSAFGDIASVSTAADAKGLSISREELDAETLLRERIMLGLRLASGFDLAGAAAALGVRGWTPERSRAAEWLEDRGRIVREGSVLRIPHRAWLWCDDTASRLF